MMMMVVQLFPRSDVFRRGSLGVADSHLSGRQRNIGILRPWLGRPKVVVLENGPFVAEGAR